MTVISEMQGQRTKWLFFYIPLLSIAGLVSFLIVWDKDLWFEDTLFDALTGLAVFTFVAIFRLLFKSHEAWTYLNSQSELLSYLSRLGVVRDEDSFEDDALVAIEYDDDHEDVDGEEVHLDYYDVVKINNLESGGQISWGYRRVSKERIPFWRWALKSVSYSVMYARNDTDKDQKPLPRFIEHP